MKKLRWVGIAFVVLLFIGGVANKNYQDWGAFTLLSLVPSVPKGYAPQSHEAAVVEYLIRSDAHGFSNGEDSVLGEGLLSVTAIEVAQAYNDNQVAADKKYFKKSLLLTGKIENINSGLGNEPYIVLRGLNEFMAPQVRFHKANIDKISSLIKSEKLVLVCDGAGAIAGTPMFNNCEFADDYASKEMTKLNAEVSNFLDGRKQSSANAALLAIVGIAYARSLPENSTCFTWGSKCDEELKAVEKGKDFKSKVSTVVSELASAGVKFPKNSKP